VDFGGHPAHARERSDKVTMWSIDLKMLAAHRKVNANVA
jgi:hypothetical protein